MNSLRRFYQAILPYDVRTRLYRARVRLVAALAPTPRPLPEVPDVGSAVDLDVPPVAPNIPSPLPEVPDVGSAVDLDVPPVARNIPASIAPLLDELQPLPGYWHEAGTLSNMVLEAIVHYLSETPWPIAHSVETGCGKSTIVLSHISANHKVFALEGADNSLPTVMNSPWVKKEPLELILGPSQRTLPAYEFTHSLQFALIDGPHGFPFPELEYYYIYPHLDPGALLVIDDIHIPTIKNFFEFLVDDEMFTLLEVVQTTGLFRRTDAPTFDPLGDNWWTQKYNLLRNPGILIGHPVGEPEKTDERQP